MEAAPLGLRSRVAVNLSSGWEPCTRPGVVHPLPHLRHGWLAGEKVGLIELRLL